MMVKDASQALKAFAKEVGLCDAPFIHTPKDTVRVSKDVLERVLAWADGVHHDEIEKNALSLTEWCKCRTVMCLKPGPEETV